MPSGFQDSAQLAAIDSGQGYAGLPHNLEVEQALLGAILVNNDASNRVSFLTSDHFFDPLHQRIYATAMRLIERGQLAIPATLKTYLEADPGLKEVGGPQYLARLAAAATSLRRSTRDTEFASPGLNSTPMVFTSGVISWISAT